MTISDFGNLRTADGLKSLETHMTSASYVTGAVPSKDDETVFSKVGVCPAAAQYPNASRWFRHMMTFTEEERLFFAVGSVPAPAAADEDDDDLFGGDDDVDEELLAKQKEAQKAKEAAKKPKKKVVDKTQVAFTCRPNLGDDQAQWPTPEQLHKEITESIVMDGLVWNKNVMQQMTCFGMWDLQVVCVIEDEKIPSVDIVRNALACVGITDEEQKKKKIDRLDGDEDDDDEEELPGRFVNVIVGNMIKI